MKHQANRISHVTTKLYQMDNVIDGVFNQVGIDIIQELRDGIRVVSHTDPDAHAWISPFDFPPGYESIKEEHPYCFGWNSRRRHQPVDKYPRFGQAETGMNVHRLVYQVFKNGGLKLPTDKHVAHLCNNKWCVNAEHLALVTSRENAWHRLTHGNMTNMVKKSNKLEASQAKTIRELYASGMFTHQQIADQYNVSRKLVTRICLGEIWADAGGPITRNYDRKRNNTIQPDSKKAKEIHRIRELYESGVSQKELAKLYNMSQTAIGQIVTNKWFKDILAA